MQVAFENETAGTAVLVPHWNRELGQAGPSMLYRESRLLVFTCAPEVPSALPAVDVPPTAPSSTSRQATYYFLDAQFPLVLLPLAQPS
jgi:hypothetical protein